MRSELAERLDAERRAAEASATPAQRVALALRLGHRDLVRFAQAQGMTLAEARGELNRRAQLGRTPSKVMDELNR